MIKGLSILFGGSLAFWLATALPVYFLGSDAALLLSTLALVLCVVPSGGTLAWCHWALQGPAEQQLFAVLGGTVVRLLLVLGAGMCLFYGFPDFHHARFWIWIVLFYLFTLVLEMSLVLKRYSVASRG